MTSTVGPCSSSELVEAFYARFCHGVLVALVSFSTDRRNR